MEILYSKIFIIQNDIPTASHCDFEHLDNVNEYIETIAEEFSCNISVRDYCFDEQYQTARNNVIFIATKVDALLSLPDNDVLHESIGQEIKNYIVSQPAQRLAAIENDINDNHKQIGQIPKGVLIVAVTRTDDGVEKLLFAKADYAEFMEEHSGDKKLGLPTKKKIYKAASFDVCYDEDTHEYFFSNIKVCDTSKRDAKYWWKNFLELRELRSNELNTQKAYTSIKNKIIAPLKSDHKADYISMFNFNLGIFSTNTQFDIEDYIVQLQAFQFVDQGIDKDSMVNRLRQLPNKDGFDAVFEKVPGSITDRVKRETISLTNNVDLTIKGNIENLPNTIIAETDRQGRKFVKILSPSGYDFFHREPNNIQQ